MGTKYTMTTPQRSDKGSNFLLGTRGEKRSAIEPRQVLYTRAKSVPTLALNVGPESQS